MQQQKHKQKQFLRIHKAFLFVATYGILLLITLQIDVPKVLSSLRGQGEQQNRLRHLQDSPSFPSADTFPDRHLVLDMMQLSNDIYDVDEKGLPPSDAITDPKFEIQFWLQADFSTEVMIVTTTSTSLYDSPKPLIAVVFRGSEEIDDWLVNGNIITEPSEFINAPDSVRIHQGFQGALFDQGIVDIVEAKILNLIKRMGDSEVVITGHSLG